MGPAWNARRPLARMARGLQPPSSIVHPLHPTTGSEPSASPVPTPAPAKPHASPNAAPGFNSQPHESSPSSSPLEINPPSAASTSTTRTSSSSTRTSKTSALQPSPHAITTSSSTTPTTGSPQGPPQAPAPPPSSSHASPGPVEDSSTLPPETTNISPSYQPQPRLGSSASGGSFQEPTSVANSSPSSNRPQTLHIALPVAIASVAVLLALGVLLLLRRRRRTSTTASNQPYAAAGPDDSFVTASASTSSFASGMGVFGGRSATSRGIPNPFADAESPRASVDANHAFESARPASEEYSHFYHDREDTEGSPFRDSYAAAAHHAEVLEASRFETPRLNSTPRSEAPQFVWNTDSASSLANNAGHSTPHLAFSNADSHPVPPLPEMAQLQGSLNAAQLVLPHHATRSSPGP